MPVCTCSLGPLHMVLAFDGPPLTVSLIIDPSISALSRSFRVPVTWELPGIQLETFSMPSKGCNIVLLLKVVACR